MSCLSGSFYDSLAEDYDSMVGKRARNEQAVAFVGHLQGLIRFDSAVDVATGTGTYALALASAGVETMGIDLSAAMLEKAKRNGLGHDLDIYWQVGSMDDLAGCMREPVDLVLCMGNSLPHILTDQGFNQTLSGFAAGLNYGGHVVVQVLNYDKILKERERIVEITRQGQSEYIRFYDFGVQSGGEDEVDSLLDFNVLTIRWSEAGPSHRLDATSLRPYRYEDLAPAMQKQGLEVLQTFGGLDLSPFDVDVSSSLIILAQKGGC